jgi:hypothetical protein
MGSGAIMRSMTTTPQKRPAFRLVTETGSTSSAITMSPSGAAAFFANISAQNPPSLGILLLNDAAVTAAAGVFA